MWAHGAWRSENRKPFPTISRGIATTLGQRRALAYALATSESPGVGGAIGFIVGADITQAFQFVDTGNAELGFVAASQLTGNAGGSQWLRAPVQVARPGHSLSSSSAIWARPQTERDSPFPSHILLHV
jgi:hypothetical protein